MRSPKLTSFVFSALVLGSTLGLAAGVSTPRLHAASLESEIVDPGGDNKGHNHNEPNGTLYCHCTGTACNNCVY